MHVPKVEAIYVADAAGEPVRRLPEAVAVAGQGLVADRYLRGDGHFSGDDTCEVTLIEGEALERMEVKFGVHVKHGEHRRNIVTRGIALDDLRGQRFTVGEAILEYDSPRPPCGYLERITERGMAKAMMEGPGICARIVRGGALREGDAILWAVDRS
jgi:MOSC domain-containing protein YiiM